MRLENPSDPFFACVLTQGSDENSVSRAAIICVAAHMLPLHGESAAAQGSLVPTVIVRGPDRECSAWSQRCARGSNPFTIVQGVVR